MFFSKTFPLVSIAAGAALLASGCEQSFDTDSHQGRQGIIDATNIMLSKADCTGALERILPLYASSGTGNDVRMITAAAYGCHAHVNFFKLVGDLAANTGSLSSGLFWNLLAKLFPSVKISDRVVEAAGLGSEALFSVLNPGQVILPEFLINVGTQNPGSLVVGDRTNDSNLYLLFLAMAAIGASENRWGNPDPVTFAKGNPLPWSTAATVDDDGCAYASAVVNFADALGVAVNTVGGSMQANFSTLKTFFQDAIYQACDDGCQNVNPGWGASGCTSPTTCEGCPLALRSRSACEEDSDNQASCAAAGIVGFINNSPIGGWQ
jgi:hypothetical protein